MDDRRPDQIFYLVTIPLTITADDLAAGVQSFRQVVRCDRHRPTGLPHSTLPATADVACEICEHDE